MKLIVCLGNLGEKYAQTRHNIGWWVAADMAKTYNFPTAQSKFKGEFVKTTINGENVGVLCPLTFMNLSGESVRLAMDFFKLTPDNIYVIHDDLDLEPAQLKVKFGGGAGGHNGLKSVIQHIGNDFNRIRIGIGHPGEKAEVSNYVLSNFSKTEAPNFEIISKVVAENITDLTSENANDFLAKLGNKKK